MAINRCLKIVDHAYWRYADHRVAGERQRQQSSSANASRDGKTNFGFDTVPRYLQGLFGNARADVEASGGNTFNGKGKPMPAIPLAAR